MTTAILNARGPEESTRQNPTTDGRVVFINGQRPGHEAETSGLVCRTVGVSTH